MSDFDDDLQLDNWLNLTLSQPHDPVACREMLMRAANGDTFAISDRPEITFPWRRTIAERLRDESKNCWRLTDSEGTVRDEPEHGTPMGLTDDEGVTDKSLTGDEWGEYYNTHVSVLRQEAGKDGAEDSGECYNLQVRASQEGRHDLSRLVPASTTALCFRCRSSSRACTTGRGEHERHFRQQTTCSG